MLRGWFDRRHRLPCGKSHASHPGLWEGCGDIYRHHSETSIRISPSREARSFAHEYAPQVRDDWEAMLFGYQTMPAGQLFIVQSVQLIPPLEVIVSNPGMKAICDRCGEEIVNGREITREESILCRGCAGEGYYQLKIVQPERILFSDNAS